ARARPGACGRRVRARSQPHVELRPVAARHALVAEQTAFLHGQGRALQPDPRPAAACRRRLPRAAGRGGRRGRAEGGGDLPRGRRRRDVPGGDAPAEGPAEEVRAQAEDGCRADRSERSRATRPGGAEGHRPALPAREAGGRLRRAGPGRRPGRETERAGIPDRDPTADGAGLRALPGDMSGERSPLLAIDGDSLAHRPYHALPKSMKSATGRPSGALVGFANFLLRLWEAEEPRAVVVGWDSLGVPTYRSEAFPSYQSGRQFDVALVEQLDLLPALVSALGFTAAKAPGYEADDFLAAAVAQEEARPGRTLVATSDRDAFQLVSELTMVLQPVKGVSELARIGPAEVRERYGVEPGQVPDFIALRGDPSDKLPGARGIGPKTAASILAEHGTLAAALAAGRCSAPRRDLLLYRRAA